MSSYGSNHGTYFPPSSTHPNPATYDPHQQYPPSAPYPTTPSMQHSSAPSAAYSSSPSQGALMPHRRSSSHSSYQANPPPQSPYDYQHQQLQPVPQGEYLQPVPQEYYPPAPMPPQPPYYRRSSHASHHSHHSRYDDREEKRTKKEKNMEQRPTLGGSVMKVVDYVWGMLDPKRN